MQVEVTMSSITHDTKKIRVNFMFYALVTVHLGTVLVKNQLNTQFFSAYVYYNLLHVSGSHVLIIRGVSCINMTSGICHSVQVTICTQAWTACILRGKFNK